jgi:hypothetical protein
MTEGTKSTILIAIISAISAIVVAVITTYGTIAVSGSKMGMISSDLDQAKKEMKNISSDLQQISNLPIGTIVPSMLQPTKFAKEVGDLDRVTMKWVLADGEKDITNSLYAQLSGNTRPPDLRGMFLRGMNFNGNGQDPEKDRIAGEYQEDALHEHTHNTNALAIQWKAGGSWEEGQGIRHNPNNKWIVATVTEVKDARTAKETRPKNVAVYFYIKIN